MEKLNFGAKTGKIKGIVSSAYIKLHMGFHLVPRFSTSVNYSKAINSIILLQIARLSALL